MNRSSVASLATIILSFAFVSCVEAPGGDEGSATWDRYVDELAPLKDADTAVVDALPDGDQDAVNDEDLLLADDDDADPACLYQSCQTHEDCKDPSCEATFCTAVFGALITDNPNACAMRCDPVNNNAECPDGMTCNDQIQAGSDLGIDIDGAKGICAPPTR